jgi:hypothetical protein
MVVNETQGCGRLCDEYVLEAKLIQSSLLPPKGLCCESVEIASRFIPYSEVGGDFADFFFYRTVSSGSTWGTWWGRGCPQRCTARS